MVATYLVHDMNITTSVFWATNCTIFSHSQAIPDASASQLSSKSHKGNASRFFFNPIFKNLLVSQFLLQFYRVFRRFLQRGLCVLQIFIGCGDPRADLQTYMTRRWIVEGHWILQYSIMWNICQSESYLNPDDIKWLLKEYYIITSP